MMLSCCASSEDPAGEVTEPVPATGSECEEVKDGTLIQVIENGQVKEVALKEAKPLWQLEAEEQAQKSADAQQKLEEEKLAQEETEAKKLKDASETKKAEAKESDEHPAVVSEVRAEKPSEEKTAEKVEEAKEQTADLSKTRYEFEVTLVSAKNLRDEDWLPGGSDAYCVCEAIGRTKAKFQSPVVSNRSNPEWNHTEKIAIGHMDSLKFSVLDKDVAGKDDLLGDVELPFSKIAPSGFKGDLRLKHTNGDTAKSAVSDLVVEVKYLRSYTVKAVAAKSKAKAKAKA